MTSVQVETASPLVPEIAAIAVAPTTLSPAPIDKFNQKVTKNSIRSSLRASTVDGVFAGIFTITTSGILLSNFLVELDASPIAFGMLSSIPMLVNLIQPLGAYLSERSQSRCRYSLMIYGPSRLLWLILIAGIAAFSWGLITSHQLVVLTLLIVLFSHLCGGLGSASWLSWMAMLVHRRLRGRYFGIRNSLVSLTNLICVPLAGVAVSTWRGGTLQGYGVVLFIGILSGIASLGCQYFKLDVNPQEQNTYATKIFPEKAVDLDPNNLDTTGDRQPTIDKPASEINPWKNLLKDTNFLIFLLYFSFWMFAVNLSAPFFNLYMLDTLDIDVSWVTLYSSIQAGANMLMLIVWGKLADRIGNRLILFFVGILFAIAPLLWLGIGHNSLSLWFWLPMLHIFLGGTGAAIDLCGNTMQLEVAPVKNQSIYFATIAAVAGFCGAFGTTLGGLIIQNAYFGGLAGLFALSTMFRIIALVPLMFVQEARRQSFLETFQGLWQVRKKLA
ncbi:MFS transporter [Chlorogloeopsis fritschii PCC 9212]|uniref:MFS transporter n=1 Tax=Chlorogloeopsis fritschii PCC 6912 TaxID=211165 RepID=A0A433NRU5_CHLFR|nr:MFS transporter [Chlorogloeopsis fritschii]MBF2007561.1 MFS transporter [Chlorogloeopsis fritschii C42_A2020_084]RUR86955.1 MFS transporter [Chlorogloeopsis fritschii PCC 6912]